MFEELKADDILFIDSSHTIRIGGDVVFVIHLQDIFLPHHYPKEWVMNRRSFWTEQYLVQAFLAFNKSFEIIWSYGIMQEARSDALAATFPNLPAFGNGSSMWLRRTG